MMVTSFPSTVTESLLRTSAIRTKRPPKKKRGTKEMMETGAKKAASSRSAITAEHVRPRMPSVFVFVVGWLVGCVYKSV